MLWSEPWLTLASSAEGTLIPPPRPVFPAESEWSFRLLPAADAIRSEWLTFVGSALSVSAAKARVGEAGALVGLLQLGPERDGEGATCILRPVGERTWRLETFVARPRGQRLGEWLLRCVMWELWPATLVFQWELAGLPVLVGAWWRGWLAAAVTVEKGWRWRRAAETAACGFCPVTAAWIPPQTGVEGRPVLVRDMVGNWSVVVADSGHCDGWGHVLAVGGGGVPDWSRVAGVGGWRELWYRGPRPPLGEWIWTGEWVVIGRVGVGDRSIQTRWLTADI
jgi:hypothetical protein